MAEEKYGSSAMVDQVSSPSRVETMYWSSEEAANSPSTSTFNGLRKDPDVPFRCGGSTLNDSPGRGTV